MFLLFLFFHFLSLACLPFILCFFPLGLWNVICPYLTLFIPCTLTWWAFLAACQFISIEIKIFFLPTLWLHSLFVSICFSFSCSLCASLSMLINLWLTKALKPKEFGWSFSFSHGVINPSLSLLPSFKVGLLPPFPPSIHSGLFCASFFLYFSSSPLLVSLMF